VDPERLAPAMAALVDVGMVERSDERHLHLTEPGRQAMASLTEARRSGLTELLEGWDPDDHPELVEMVRHLAEELMADDDRLLSDAGLHSGAPS
jgi:DNA-binding MarR family transcriptional regulator